MIELIINKSKIKVPNELNEVSLAVGLELIEFANKELSFNDKIAIISTLSKLEPEILSLASKETIELIYDNINFIKLDNEQTSFFSETFKLDNVLYGLTDLDNMTVHEYSDIQFYMSEPENNIDKIMCIMFRPVINKKQSLKNILKNIVVSMLYRNIVPKSCKSYTVASYSEKDLERAELFGNKLSLDFAIAAYQYALDKKQKIDNCFPNLFKAEIPEEDKDQYDAPETIKNKGKSFEQIWGMYHVIMSLSSSLQEREEWLKKPIKELFVCLSYMNHKNYIENERNKINN
jgi:hypothetical protein